MESGESIVSAAAHHKAETPAPSVSAADALARVAAAYLAAGDGADSTSAAPAPTRYQVVVHLDRDLLRPGDAVAATLDDGTPVSAETLRRVACDAGLVPALLSDGGDTAPVLDIGLDLTGVN